MFCIRYSCLLLFLLPVHSFLYPIKTVQESSVQESSVKSCYTPVKHVWENNWWEDIKKQVQSAYKDKIVMKLHNHYWIYFISTKKTFPINEGASKFFIFPLANWVDQVSNQDFVWLDKIPSIAAFRGSLSDSLSHLWRCAAFIDPNSDIYLTPELCAQLGARFPTYLLSETTNFDSISDSKNAFALKQEALEAAGYVYKIHLQVSRDYLISFIQDFLDLSVYDPRVKNYVTCFKVLRNYSERWLKTDGTAVATIVMYIDCVQKSRRERVLNDIINALLERYRHVSEEIALKDSSKKVIAPRWNYKVNPLIWIAGGHGDDKERYIKFLEETRSSRIKSAREKRLQVQKLSQVGDITGAEIAEKEAILLEKQAVSVKNTVYTDDYVFIQGAEFRPFYA